MSLSSVFNIAGTGMSAQTTRLNTISSNIANAETVFTDQQAQQNGTGTSLFADQDNSGRGVQVMGVVEDQSSLTPRYEPNHPAADKDGYVYYPNVNVVEEMADMISASRAFQTNTEMMNTAKQMMTKVLTLGQ
jgi:flagellar basal-body rod protein FlgC